MEPIQETPVAELPTVPTTTEAPVEAACGCGGNPNPAPEPTAAEEAPAAPAAPAKPNYVYALGQIRASFPSMDLEKEFLQAIKAEDTTNVADNALMYQVLSQPENRYIAEEMCFTFSVENIDTYLLQPMSDHQLTSIIESLKPNTGVDCSAVIGIRGPIAPPEMCNGLQLPMVVCRNSYTFDIDAFVKAMPKVKGVTDNVIKELFNRLLQLADNAGATPEHRALNYVALRYPEIYHLVAQKYSEDQTLYDVDVKGSRLSGSRDIAQVIFTFVNRKTDVREQYFTRVDVTGMFPFLVSKLQPYYDRF